MFKKVIGYLAWATVLLVGAGLAVAGTGTAHAATYPARYRIAAAKLAQRPALILPGQWQSPAGPALVAECFASYPKPGPELLGCLTQPDPRRTDRRVMTLHQNHVNHLNHINRR